MSKGINIVGSKRSDSLERDQFDLYKSPKRVIKDLLHLIRLNDFNIWENACGDGVLVTELKKFTNSNVVGSDIKNYTGKYFVNDFLVNPSWFKKKFGIKPDVIITNPPYKHATIWVIKSLKASDRYVILLLKLVFLEGVNRHTELFRRYEQLKNIYIYSFRLRVTHKLYRSRSAGTVCYAWFVWDKLYSGQPVINWIPKTHHTTASLLDYFK